MNITTRDLKRETGTNHSSKASHAMTTLHSQPSATNLSIIMRRYRLRVPRLKIVQLPAAEEKHVYKISPTCVNRTAVDARKSVYTKIYSDNIARS
eukprot:1348337-Pleurochrysis_carterae.AAC.1